MCVFCLFVCNFYIPLPGRILTAKNVAKGKNVDKGKKLGDFFQSLFILTIPSRP